MPPLYDSITDTIGRTPVVRLQRLAPDGVDIYVKLESRNPMASVKDRMALSTIEAAEASGALRPGQTVIEATSGNTGIGLAMVCAARGYPLVLTMAESFSLERRKILRFLGARVVITPAELKGTGMVAKAEELAAEHDWFLVRQFENPANPEAHVRTTAVEILDDFGDRRLDVFVTGFGTGGTVQGVGRVLRERSPDTRIVLCEPDNAPMVGSDLPQQRGEDGGVSASHPQWRPHPVQGWSPDFIPAIVERALDLELVDQVLPVSGAEAMRCSRELARREGIFTGISGGATLAGALAVAADAEPGSAILAMLPDTAERYLSTPLFEDIPVDMTDEEEAIARSTPSARFDHSATAPAPAPDDDKPLDDAAVRFVDEALADREQPVALFALEWCEFCWAVRKLFQHFEVPFRSIDLDSVAFQEDDRGGRIRAVLRHRLGTNTIPQVYIAGEHVGGATDTFAAAHAGSLQRRLAAAGVEPADPGENFDPWALLPRWLHQRPA